MILHYQKRLVKKEPKAQNNSCCWITPFQASFIEWVNFKCCLTWQKLGTKHHSGVIVWSPVPFIGVAPKERHTKESESHLEQGTAIKLQTSSKIMIAGQSGDVSFRTWE